MKKDKKWSRVGSWVYLYEISTSGETSPTKQPENGGSHFDTAFIQKHELMSNINLENDRM